ncbi:hypothetical protein EPK99_09990 [Neorhizobium lilium]|uniref:Transmembrane protein n=1 Tax=Neorhizobium lilium TaxID=2503024 RepID=A0A444LJ11_9HYPH|nr:hypothetical protein [Neorhizobium lilium]RWX78897.1 hypothetical protein EPK99_09990 [Neorhizobium lilium]
MTRPLAPATGLQPPHPDGTRLIGRRVVLHFPGFEPLDAGLHHARYQRVAIQSGRTWGLDLKVGPLSTHRSAAYFDISCLSGQTCTETRFHIFDHAALVSTLTGRTLLTRIVSGFYSAGRVILSAGMTGYFRHAWRFGLFFVFPFLLVALSVLVTLCLATLPITLRMDAWNYLWSLPLALAFVRYAVMPVTARLHTLHLFADWDLAIAMANLDRPDVDRWLAACVAGVRKAMEEEADEYVISSHSMGSTIAAHVIGELLEEDPDAFKGKQVIFATLGGAILQCALLRPASRLRQRVGLIARTRQVFWLEIQCLTDCVNFYKSRVVSLTGHPDAPQAKNAFIRVKNMLSAERYKRIRYDILRVHRQYVLDTEKQSNFDFTLMTAGPLPAARFADFSPRDLASGGDAE